MSDANAEAVVDELDSETDGEVIVVADPDDYNQSRRMKAVHQARANVRKAHADLPNYASEDEHYAARTDLARAVAHYGRELQPLMAETEWDHELPDKCQFRSVRVFVAADGIPLSDHDFSGCGATPPTVSMEVFGYLNRFAHKTGLGLDLDTGTDEWEV